MTAGSSRPKLPLLRADCGSCRALCCVALPTTRSADFEADKPAGIPCRHLREDDRCGIHDRLRESGWRGCAVFDCFGAGPQASRAAAGASWRADPSGAAARLYAAFGTLRRLHEAAYHLDTTLETSADTLRPTLRADLGDLLTSVAATIDQPLEELASTDPSPLQRDTAALLAAVSNQLRSVRHAAGDWAGSTPRGLRPGADLVGRDLRGQDLRALDLRGALLVAADVSDADLRWTDLLGADLRDAELGGADLTDALFLSPPQLAAARGNAATLLPGGLDRPPHWA